MSHAPVTQPRRSSRKKYVIGGALVLVAAAGGGWAMWGNSASTSAGGVVQRTSLGGPQTSDRVLARKMAFEILTTANGELEARNKVEIRNPLDQDSTVVKIVPEGTRVKQGDILIQLNVEEIQLKVDEEKLRVESARADFAVAENAYKIQEKESESKLRLARLKVELADLALQQWAEGDHQKKLQELELDCDKSVLELRRLAEVYVRSQELNAEGFLSKDLMDRDEVAYIEAISKYKTSRLALAVYEEYESQKDRKKFGSDVEEAREDLDKAKLNSKSELASKLAEMNNRREQFLGLERKLAKLTKQRDDATIYASRDGLVVYGTSVDRNSWGRGGGGDSTLAIGTQVYSNQLLMILPDTSEMVASVKVHESLAGRMKPGQPAFVKIDAASGEVYSGKVESVGVMAESGGWRDPNLREYSVKIGLENTKGALLKPAMRCEARIVLGQVSETTTVPVQAIFNDGPVQFVYSPAGGGQKFVKTPVRAGRRSDTLVEVVSGINEGDVVLVREPQAGEVLSTPFQKEALLACGYKFDENGNVMAEGSGIDAMRRAEAAGGGNRQPSRADDQKASRQGRAPGTPKSGATAKGTESADSARPAGGGPGAQTPAAAPASVPAAAVAGDATKEGDAGTPATQPAQESKPAAAGQPIPAAAPPAAPSASGVAKGARH